MLNESELINFIRQNVQMGIDGIKIVIDDVKSKEFYEELKSELREYNEIFNDAEELADRAGYEKVDINAAVKIASHLSGRLRTINGGDSKIAESMIQGSTMGVTKLIMHINEFNGDQDVLKIAERLLKFLEGNIENLKHFL